jgi:drug/metabolite transporter (DMT)-like permease
MAPGTRSSTLVADGVLLGVTFVWGATFVVIHDALYATSPFVFLSLRFALAALLCIPFLGAFRGGMRRREAWDGANLGGLLALGFGLQTVGLVEISPARSAFLTSMYVVFTPLLALPILGRVPSRPTLAGLVFSLVGLGMMSWDGGGFTAGRGDWLTLACAVAFALQIVALDRAANRGDFRRLFVVQIVTASALLPAGLALEHVRLEPSWRLAGAIALTAGPATVGAFYLQSRFQPRTTPNRAAILFASEPVFAALTTAVVRGESGLTLRGWMGAAMILTGVVIAEIRRPASPAGPVAAGPGS